MVVLAIVAVGWQIYAWRRAKTQRRLGFAPPRRERVGQVGERKQIPGQEPIRFATDLPDDAARLQAAQEAYKKASELQPGSGTALLAQLGLAGVAYDLSKYDEAQTAYEQVKASLLGASDADVKGRATEGIGLCLEAKNDREGAIKAFRDSRTAISRFPRRHGPQAPVYATGIRARRRSWEKSARARKDPAAEEGYVAKPKRLLARDQECKRRRAVLPARASRRNN